MTWHSSGHFYRPSKFAKLQSYVTLSEASHNPPSHPCEGINCSYPPSYFTGVENKATTENPQAWPVAEALTSLCPGSKPAITEPLSKQALGQRPAGKHKLPREPRLIRAVCFVELKAPTNKPSRGKKPAFVLWRVVSKMGPGAHVAARALQVSGAGPSKPARSHPTEVINTSVHSRVFLPRRRTWYLSNRKWPGPKLMVGRRWFPCVCIPIP